MSSTLRREDPWRRKLQSTPVFLPGKSYGQRSLACYSPWSCKELDMTEQLNHCQTHFGTSPSMFCVLNRGVSAEISVKYHAILSPFLV